MEGYDDISILKGPHSVGLVRFSWKLDSAVLRPNSQVPSWIKPQGYGLQSVSLQKYVVSKFLNSFYCIHES